MNCEQVRQLWDEYRDGGLHGVEAHGLEQHLADCPSCEKLWRRESSWLNVLGEKTPIVDEKPGAFAASVVKRWERAGQPSVIGRITRLSAAAAVIVLMLSLAALMVDRGESSPATRVAVNPQVDSVGVLIAGITGPTTAIRDTFDRTAALLDVSSYTDSVVDFLDATAPPAEEKR